MFITILILLSHRRDQLLQLLGHNLAHLIDVWCITLFVVWVVGLDLCNHRLHRLRHILQAYIAHPQYRIKLRLHLCTFALLKLRLGDRDQEADQLRLLEDVLYHKVVHDLDQVAAGVVEAGNVGEGQTCAGIVQDVGDEGLRSGSGMTDLEDVFGLSALDHGLFYDPFILSNLSLNLLNFHFINTVNE